MITAHSRRGFSLLELAAAVTLLGLLMAASAIASTRIIAKAENAEANDVVVSVIASNQALYATRGVFADHSYSALESSADLTSGTSSRPDEVAVRLVSLDDGRAAFTVAAMSDSGDCVTGVAGPRGTALWANSTYKIDAAEADGSDCTAPTDDDSRFDDVVS